MIVEEVNELREEIQQRNKKAKRITADYQREMEATWNRWEDSDGEVEKKAGIRQVELNIPSPGI